MDPIFDFSAAPHLPLSLRERAKAAMRPELLLASLTDASTIGGHVIALKRNGELYIAFANTA